MAAAAAAAASGGGSSEKSSSGVADALALPWVLLHNVLSVDGNSSGFAPDARMYYGVAAKLEETATLCSALGVAKEGEEVEPESEADLAAPEAVGDDDERPVCLVVDSRGRVRTWHVLRRSGIWKNFVALISDATPAEYVEYLAARRISFIRAGADKVDLRVALRRARTEHGATRVRVDGCAALNAALLADGLVDELSLLIAPTVVGAGAAGTTPLVGAIPGSAGVPLKLISALDAGDTGYVWLRYAVIKDA